MFNVFVLTPKWKIAIWRELKFHSLKQLCKRYPKKKKKRYKLHSFLAFYLSTHFVSFLSLIRRKFMLIIKVQERCGSLGRGVLMKTVACVSTRSKTLVTSIIQLLINTTLIVYIILDSNFKTIYLIQWSQPLLAFG